MTNQEIKNVGQTIAQETQIGGNTAARVGGVVEGIGVALDNKDAANGYYQATINGGTITVNAPNYLLGSGGNLRIKMPSVGTTASTLTIGNANAVQLWYNGAAVSAQNTWEAGEIISVFYDGTRFMASNSQGGGGKAEKIKYDNSQSGLAAENVQGAIDDAIKSMTEQAYTYTEGSFGTSYDWYINNSGNYVVSSRKNLFRCYIQKVTPGQKFEIKANGEAPAAFYAFLESIPTNPHSGTPADFIEGYGTKIRIAQNETGIINIPTVESDIYLYIQRDNDTYDFTPEYIHELHAVKDIVLENRDNINTLQDKVDIIEDNLGSLTPLMDDYNFISGTTINYDSGTEGTSSVYLATEYIPLSDAPKIIYPRIVAPSTTSVIGMAFYSSQDVSGYISGERFLQGEAGSQPVMTEINVPTGALYARFTVRYTESFNVFKTEGMYSIKDIFDKTERNEDRLYPLKGKKVSIIGDSISCFGTESQTRNDGYNAPYWIVKSCDVGNSIQSWVTWLDVYKSVDSTTRTNKTIGGITLTPSMIGTKQTFTPVASDVGKAIGVARWAGSYTTKPWWKVLIEESGAELCNNASWSGARMVPIPEGNVRHAAFVLSEAYSEYTLGRVANRDENGNTITPDVIIIYRGVNDFSAEDPEGGAGDTVNEPIETPDMKNFTEITDTKNFTQGYIWTILKLREKYPKAYIYICTLNIFKRVNYSHFPTNNGTYTLPQYNDKIREIADLMGCGVIEFDKDGITFENCYSEGYITDSETIPTHPNTLGHKKMGAKAIVDVRYIL